MKNQLNEETYNDLRNTPYNPANDRLDQYSITDDRKPIITLMDIHRLKLLTIKKKFDQEKEVSLIQKIYNTSTPSDEESF